jgi:hypothetical protein
MQPAHQIQPIPSPTAAEVLAQLELLTQDENFRSSKRSIAFLTYVVQETLRGSADQIKERAIGIEVFGRLASYDTNQDHVVRTAATELRKRLAIYYGEKRHRGELRISLLPGSYVPKFTYPEFSGSNGGEDAEFSIRSFHGHAEFGEMEPELVPVRAAVRTASVPRGRPMAAVAAIVVCVLLAMAGLGYYWSQKHDPEYLFWKPVLDSPGLVLLAVGDVPDGPPRSVVSSESPDLPLPVPQPDASGSIPFSDAVTIADVVAVMKAGGKKVLIRRESASSFSDFRQGPAVLIGAFNNEWSLRLTRHLRYTLSLDENAHLIYIRDSKDPNSRAWSWRTDQPRTNEGQVGGPPVHDFALVSRIRNSETGHAVVVVGGLYRYGTEAAGEFLTDPQMMKSIARSVQLGNGDRNLQIVLETTVTDGTPGPPKVVACSQDE